MPAFTLPFPATAAPSTVADANIADPATRGAAGARAATVALLRIIPSGPATTFNVIAPVTGLARFVNLDTPLPAPGVTQLLALAPLPFAIASELGALAGGVPTFYLAAEAASFLPAAEDAVTRGDVIARGASALHVGVLFQDRVTVSPRTWLQAIGAVDSVWQSDAFSLLAALPRTLRVLDHTGRPVASLPFVIASPPQAAGVVLSGPVTLTNAGGFLALPATGAIMLQQQTPPTSSSPGIGRGRVYSLYAPRGPGSIAVSEPNQSASLTLPASFEGGDLQVFNVGALLGGTYHIGSSLEPIVDGAATFRRLLDELTAAAAAPAGGLPFGAALACHEPSFDFNLIHGDATTRLSAVCQALLDANADLRLLVNDAYRPRDPTLMTAIAEIAIVLLILGYALVLLLNAVWSSFVVPPVVLGIVAAVTAVTVLLLAIIAAGGNPLSELVDNLVQRFLEIGRPAVNAVNALTPAGAPRAAWASYPARFTDNPLAVEMFDSIGSPRQRRLIGFLRTTLIDGRTLPELHDQFGAWHEKLHIVRRPGAATEWSAYLGSIDVGPRWRDNPGHAGRPWEQQDDRVRDVSVVNPVHGVQARLTGPILRDLIFLWNERWGSTPAPPAGTVTRAPIWPDPPTATTLGLGASDPGHVVALGRTYFKTPPSFTYFDPIMGGTTTVEVARPPDPTGDRLLRPAGEQTLHNTLVRALDQARDYIYIEDAAFTPSEDSANPATPTIVKALMDAAPRCRRLVIVVPAAPDVRMGSDRRNALFARLRTAWGTRGVFASPVRRPFLPAAPAHTDQGRGQLGRTLDLLPPSGTPISTTALLYPYTRVPTSFPAWLWIEGELMLTTAGTRITHETLDMAELTVLRGGPWGAKMRRHVAGAPITFAQLKGILVGSSVVIVDDTFVSIGSGSISRRGLFHDGELAAFAVPAGLRSARSNPARDLRCALWAEHLGLPPQMGATVLADPLAAFDLFARRREQGNRLMPYEMLDVFGLSIPMPSGLLAALSTIGPAFTALTESLFFDLLQDPTGFGDPSVPPGS